MWMFFTEATASWQTPRNHALKSIMIINTTELNHDKIRSAINEKGWTLLPNVVPLSAIQEMRNFWVPKFSTKPSERVVWKPYVGEKNKICYTKDNFQSLYRSYDFLWNPPFHATTRQVCLELHSFRNEIIKKEYGFGTSYSENNYGIYITSSYYPAGDGWLGQHSDSNEGYPLVHYILPLTHKGIDYEEGGLYVQAPDGTKIDIDGQMKPGDVFIYNGSFAHGVDVIQSKMGIGRLQVFAIPTFFDYPLNCYRLKEEISLGGVASAKIKNIAKKIISAGKRLTTA